MSSLLRWNNSRPLSVEHPLGSVHEQMNKMMNEFYRRVNSGKGMDFDNLRLVPAMDLVEDRESFKLEVEVPGMDEKDIKVSVEENTLIIQGEKTISKKNEAKNYLSREIDYGCYERRVSLPDSADLEKISASCKKGMLWICIPKKAETKAKSREINVHNAEGS